MRVVRWCEAAERWFAAGRTAPTPSGSPTPTSGNPITDIEHKWGISLPPWLIALLSVLGAAAAIVVVMKPLVPVAKAIGHRVAKLTGRLNAEEEARAVRFRLFAKHVENQLNRLAENEEWLDDRFAELEAEIEIEGTEWLARWLRWLPVRTTKRRRVSSLTRALERSSERLIVLEGEPGAGKSVTLRHLAVLMARKAASARKPQVVPLYVNLKEFHPSSHPVTSDVVREFVLSSLKRVKDRSVEVFLEEEFDTGLSAGRWLLILDSFDEAPEILSAVDADPVILEYSGAISDFLHGVNQCRGIIASREFRGPRALRLPRFKVMPLTAKQQDDLVRRFGLGADARRRFREGMATADGSIRQLSTNPMFLSLVCSYVRDQGGFPAASHVVFEAYVRERLDRDAERIKRRFQLDAAVVRAVAERVAYAMTGTESMGLSPSRRTLQAALPYQPQLDAALDALEYIKLGRATIDDNAGPDSRQFSFSHRRFQEYFATCVVLRETAKVEPGHLLTSGRWRETAVTLLQTQPLGELHELFGVMEARLTKVVRANIGSGRPFDWGRGTLHILGILASGMASRRDEIPEPLRKQVGLVLTQAWLHGNRLDQKWAVEVVIGAPDPIADRILRLAFASESAVLQDAAYTSASRLPEPSERLMVEVRRALARVAFDGRLWRENTEITAQLRRLRDPERVLPALRTLKGGQVLGVGWALLEIQALTLFCVELTRLSTRRPNYSLDIFFGLLISVVVVMAAADVVALLKIRTHVPRGLKYLSMNSVRGPGPTLAKVICVILLNVGFLLAPAWLRTEGILACVVPVSFRIASVHTVEHGCAGFKRTLLMGPLSAVRHGWAEIWSSQRFVLADLLVAGVGATAIGGTFAAGVALFYTRLWLIPITVLGLMMAVTGMRGLVAGVRSAQNRLRARRAARSVKETKEPFTAAAVLDLMVNGVSDDFGVLLVLRTMRARAELIGDGALDLLTALAWGDREGLVPELAAWKERDSEGYRKLRRRISEAVIDQVTLIAEDVRATAAKNADA